MNYNKYYNKLVIENEKRKSDFPNQKVFTHANNKYYTNVFTYNNFKYNLVIATSNSNAYGGDFSGLIVELYLDDQYDYKEQLIQLKKDKDEIESKIGLTNGNIVWQSESTKGTVCRVFARLEADIDNESKWDDYINWQLNTMIKFLNVLPEYTKNIVKMRDINMDNWKKVENEFRKWAVPTVKKASSINTYINNSMNKKIPLKLIELQEKDDMFVSMFQITEINILKELSYRLLKGDLKVFNANTSNREPSAAINKYISFLEFKDKPNEPVESSDISLNQILYGPPGTGKTYTTINETIRIIDPDFYEQNKGNRDTLKDEFEKYKESGQIEFITFHQSYGYEEFVEGIKATTNSKDEITYKIESGIFKKVSIKAKENFKNSKKSLEQLQEELSLKEKIETFLNDSYESDIEFSKTKGGKFKIKELNEDDIIIHTEDSNYNDNSLRLSFKEFFQIIDSDIEITTSRQMAKEVFGINNQRQKDTYYASLYKDFKKVKFYTTNDVTIEEDLKMYVLIIDEINRGNISKIFGELITLIEDSKRFGAGESIEITLPYSGNKFSVPKNLYILGTMNTADRSIALMDTALRRRFDFKEMLPNLSVLSNNDDEVINFESNNDETNDLIVNNINIRLLLKKINQRIEYLYDRDHTIGHAYFISLKNLDAKNFMIELGNIFRNKVIPLLQEYFYDDWEKIRLVLGDNQKKDISNQFIQIKNDDVYQFDKLFGKVADDTDVEDETKIFTINNDAFKNINTYIGIYKEL